MRDCDSHTAAIASQSATTIFFGTIVTVDGMAQVHGAAVDDKTRCVHYSSAVDVVALKFKCCGKYYPCFQCHEDDGAAHAVERWTARELSSGEKVVLCGECKAELTFSEYARTEISCIRCGAGFNPKCALHYDKYFDLGK